MKNILITGAAGFIGSNLSEHLIKNNFIIGVDNFDNFYPKRYKKNNISNLLKNNNFKFYNVDILHPKKMGKLLKKYKIDLIIHLAAKAGVRPSLEKPIEYCKNNIEGTINVLEFAKERGIKNFIFASSSSVYGNGKQVPFHEHFSVDNPISPYAATKKSCELICYTYHHLYDINISVLRFFTVYGRRQRPDLAITKFTNLIDSGKPIDVFGDGNTYRDYTYIDDIVYGIEKCISWLMSQKTKTYHIFNLGKGGTTKLSKLIKLISKNLRKEAIINNKKRQPGDVDRTYADIERAKYFFGYNPKTKIENGIKKFIEYYLNK